MNIMYGLILLLLLAGLVVVISQVFQPELTDEQRQQRHEDNEAGIL